jgi:feruloyl esterase
MSLRWTLIGSAGLALVSSAAMAAAPSAPMGPAVACESLARTALPNARITGATAVPAGPFASPGAGAQVRPLQVPAFCRVQVKLTPSSDSDINSELWLPTTGWNGKFMMVGNGAWAGNVGFAAMVAPLARGYAVASTDTGHVGGAGDFARGHPEKWIDYGYRAVHETTVKGKAISAAFFGAAPRLSYWNGCSTGGKQGLKAVQAYPDDFDGVIAGAPANNWSRLQTRSLWMSQINMPREGVVVLDGPDYDLLNRSALAECDRRDGVADNEIADPRACRFKPSDLLCRDGAVPGQCLTAAQVEVADKIYSGPRNPRTGELIYPGPSIGSEKGWPAVANKPWALGVDQYRYYAFNDVNWDFRGLDLDRDLPRMLQVDAGVNDATDPDISAFRTHGGKLIHYHGWSDPLISTDGSINYYEQVAALQGGLAQTGDFYRLFLVPNMGHCNGGYTFDWIGLLESWVEQGQAPDLVLGQRVSQAAPGAAAAPATRPICAYPAVMHYKGPGSTEAPESYSCATGPRGPRTGLAPG